VGGVATTTVQVSADTTITADYSGDTDYRVSSDSEILHFQHATTTIVSSSKSTTVVGESVTFTATVAASSATPPTGPVQCYVDNLPWGVPVTLVDGEGSVSLTTLAPGIHVVYAAYTADDQDVFASSTAQQITQTVDRLGTAISLVSSKPTTMPGQSVTFTAN